MTRRNHHARIKAKGARQVGDGRCRNRAAEHDIDARARKARLKGCLEHIARDAGILADQDGRVARRTLPAKDPPSRLAETKHKIWRDGSLADSAAHTISTKISPT